MYEGKFVNLEMKMMLDGSKIPEQHSHECQIISYDEEIGKLTLLLRDGELSDLQLYAKYDCYIHLKEYGMKCVGSVWKRYRGEKGNTLEFVIEQGFYKININCVDK